MFEITRDADPRRTELIIKHTEGRFWLAESGTVLVLPLKEARKLVEDLMTETMRVNLLAEEHEAEDA